MITLTRGRPLGPILRNLRLDAGLTLDQLADGTHLTRSGISKRENRPSCTVGALVDHSRALGFDVALVPARHPHARPTGTGWPT